MERMVASYQDKLDSVTNSYQEKVNILENKLVDKDLSGESNKNGLFNGNLAPLTSSQSAFNISMSNGNQHQGFSS